MQRVINRVQFFQFLSTPSARRATDFYYPVFANLGISIHALREEGDYTIPQVKITGTAISIHALREEGDLNCTISSHIIENFYPRPPRGGRRAARDKSRPVFPISIHALREEGDRLLLSGVRKPRNFYPRPPRGGRPKFDEKTGLFENISIHALREEGDGISERPRTAQTLFLSTPSARRATLSSMAKILRMLLFLSTPSARRATRFRASQIQLLFKFLSTPSARRATSISMLFAKAFLHFYPRPPRGGRLPTRKSHCVLNYFYPRPPRGGRHRA